MQQIVYSLLLAALCAPATAGGVCRQHQEPAAKAHPIVTEPVAPADTVRHQPLTEAPVALSEVVVTGLTGAQKLRHSPAPVSVVGPRQLEMTPSTNIIDAVARQPGVSQVTTGNGISKPVIRGLGYNRVVVVNDGIRQEGQQWGDEHGIEVDAQSVHSVEILKGPASLLYGSDALAGVLIFHSAPAPERGTMRADVSSEYQTNSGLLGYSLDFAGHQGSLTWSTRYSGRMAHAYKNAYDGYVYGSGLHEQALTQQFGLDGAWGHSRLTLGYYGLTPGIVEGERDETTGAFVHPVSVDGQPGETAATHDELTTYGHTLPYQRIRHCRAVLDNTVLLGGGDLRLLLGYQQNRRREYDDPLAPSVCGLDFLLHTVNYGARYTSPSLSGWHVAAGVGGMWQRSLNEGTEYLVPAYRLFDAGLYATVSRAFGRLHLSGGVRYDHRRIDGDGLSEDGEERFTAFARSFSGVTGSIGAAVELARGLDLKVNVARGFRAPNISELASNGIHEGTQRYETGNTALRPESSWQGDVGLDYSSPVVSAQIALFASRIGGYVYSARLADADGRPALRDGVPAYRYASGDARLLGGEARVDVHPLARLHVGSSFAYVSSVQLGQPQESRYLPFTPAPRWQADVRYELACGGRTFDNLFVRLAMDCNLRQDHYYAVNATETATPSYTLLHAYAGTDILSHGRRVVSLYLSCENLTDRAYQSHLSRLKYTAVNSVTGRRGVFAQGRNVTLKVVVPVAF